MKNYIKPTAVLAADIHLRETIPECRTDDFIAAMMAKFMFICNLALHHNIPLLIAGDLGDKWRWGHALEQFAIRWLNIVNPCPVVIPGQHDLPDHNINNLGRSALGVLQEAGVINLLGRDSQIASLNKITVQGIPYGCEVKTLDIPDDSYKVLMLHTLVTETSKADWPGQNAVTAKELLDKYDFDLILTGDNHKPFVVEQDDKILVNPGSMMRSTAAQIDHRPRVYLWYAKQYRVEPIYLPIEQGVVTRDHIDTKDERDGRIEAYVKRLDDTYEVGLSFEENLQKFFTANKVVTSVKDKMLQAVEAGKLL